MKERILFALVLIFSACSLWAWGMQFINVEPQYSISIGDKTVEAAEVKIAGKKCIIATRGDAIAIDCD